MKHSITRSVVGLALFALLPVTSNAFASESVTAIATLGASTAGTPVTEAGTRGTFRFDVKFATPFATAPIVLVTPLQGTNFPPTIADTFGIIVVSVTTTNFTVNVNRVDTIASEEVGWGQNLRLQYTASTP